MPSLLHKKEQDLLKKYDQLKPLLIQWGTHLDNHLLSILSEDGFDVSRVQIPPSHRIKTDNSVTSNAFYRYKEASSVPLMRIEDKVGTRIVVTTINDVECIGDIIKKQKQFWTARVSRDINKRLINPTRFDYQALHIILTPTNKAPGFEEFSKKKLKYYACEVQVRTLLQHAYAEVAHDTIYKGIFSADSQLVRVLSRSMALTEAADDYFVQSYEMMENDDTYQETFLSKLIEISNMALGQDTFSKKDVDHVLTSEVFSIFDISEIKIDSINRMIISESEQIKASLENIQSYMVRQPVIILLMYLIRHYAIILRRTWHLDEDIIQDLFFQMGVTWDR